MVDVFRHFTRFETQSTVVVSQYLNDLMIALISMFRYLDMSNTHTHAHTHIYIYKYDQICIYTINIYIYIYTCMYISNHYVYIYTLIKHTHTYIYIYICVEPVDHHVFCIGQKQDQKAGCCGRSSTTSTSLGPQRC